MVRGAGLRAGGAGNVLGIGRAEGIAGRGRVVRTGRQGAAWGAGIARGMLARGERADASATLTFLFWEQITAKKA